MYLFIAVLSTPAHQANIHAILESENQVITLMENIDRALLALDSLDEYINIYTEVTSVCPVLRWFIVLLSQL